MDKKTMDNTDRDMDAQEDTWQPPDDKAIKETLGRIFNAKEYKITENDVKLIDYLRNHML